jgi:hypothetical protein
VRTACALLTLVLSAGCAPLTCDASKCGAQQVCSLSVAPVPVATCACAPGFVADRVLTPGCVPIVRKLAVNGVELSVAESHYDLLQLEVPAGTTALAIEVMADAFVTIDAVPGGTRTRPLTLPSTSVRITLTDTARTVTRMIDLIARTSEPAWVRSSVGVPQARGAVALSGDGRVLAAEASTTELDSSGSCVLGESVIHQQTDAGWVVTGRVPGGGCVNRWLALSHDGTLLGTVEAGFGGPFALSVWRRADAGWVKEEVPPGAVGQGLVVSADGERVWVARDSDDGGSYGLIRDGGVWVVDTLLTRGTAIAASDDGALVAVGLTSRSTVAIFEREPQGYGLREVLRADGGFGASVAMSGDGTQLVVGAQGTPQTARIYERADAGFLLQLAVAPPVDPARSPRPLLLYPDVPVSMSRDGTTGAIGFPSDSSLVLADRAEGKWRLRQVLLPPQGDAVAGARFAAGVSLSGDGQRLLTSCTDCAQPLRLSVFDRH